MNLSAAVSTALAVSMLFTSALGANAQASSDIRSGFTLGAGVVVGPNAPGGQCDVGTGGLGANAGLVVRPRRPWVVELDVRSAYLFDTACAGVGVPVDTTYFIPTHSGYRNSTLRVGVETPPRFPLIRVTAGAGAFLAGRAAPFAVFDAAWSTRGTRARIFAEVERTIAHIDGIETRHDFVTHLPDVTRAITAHMTTNEFHIGMEFPFGKGTTAKFRE